MVRNGISMLSCAGVTDVRSKPSLAGPIPANVRRPVLFADPPDRPPAESPQVRPEIGPSRDFTETFADSRLTTFVFSSAAGRPPPSVLHMMPAAPRQSDADGSGPRRAPSRPPDLAAVGIRAPPRRELPMGVSAGCQVLEVGGGGGAIPQTPLAFGGGACRGSCFGSTPVPPMVATIAASAPTPRLHRRRRKTLRCTDLGINR